MTNVELRERALRKLASGKTEQRGIKHFFSRVIATGKLIFAKKKCNTQKRFQVKTVRPSTILSHEKWEEELFIGKRFLHGKDIPGEKF